MLFVKTNCNASIEKKTIVKIIIIMYLLIIIKINKLYCTNKKIKFEKTIIEQNITFGIERSIEKKKKYHCFLLL